MYDVYIIVKYILRKNVKFQNLKASIFNPIFTFLVFRFFLHFYWKTRKMN